MPNDECLLIKDLLFPLIQNSYKCFTKNGVDVESEKGKIIPETYLVSTQLPAFVGRTYEIEDQLGDNTWAISGGQQPQNA